jgi:DNA-directed RNA polymerase subunit N (RpoN/RPB10)
MTGEYNPGSQHYFEILVQDDEDKKYGYLEEASSDTSSCDTTRYTSTQCDPCRIISEGLTKYLNKYEKTDDRRNAIEKLGAIQMCTRSIPILTRIHVSKHDEEIERTQMCMDGCLEFSVVQISNTILKFIGYVLGERPAIKHLQTTHLSIVSDKDGARDFALKVLMCDSLVDIYIGLKPLDIKDDEHKSARMDDHQAFQGLIHSVLPIIDDFANEICTGDNFKQWKKFLQKKIESEHGTKDLLSVVGFVWKPKQSNWQTLRAITTFFSG